jgi:CDP-2,3-bis-(O-geranylgeranyl)-sn-glycerol synthase
MEFLFLVLVYVLPCWIFNISLNFIYPWGQKVVVIHKLNFPLDFRKNWWDERRILGDSQGFMSIVFIAILPLMFIFFFPQPYWVLLLSAVCVWMGDLIGSFIKRRLGIQRGQFLPGIDHGDYMIVAGIVFVSLEIIPIEVAFFALVLTYIFHPIVCVIGYFAGIKREPF